LVVWRAGICQRDSESTGVVGYLVGQIGSRQNPRSKKAHHENRDRAIRYIPAREVARLRGEIENLGKESLIRAAVERGDPASLCIVEVPQLISPETVEFAAGTNLRV
jgi:hypothetical protein